MLAASPSNRSPSVGMTVVGAEAGANVLNYSNAPSDIGDSLGRMLGAFAGFPLP